MIPTRLKKNLAGYSVKRKTKFDKQNKSIPAKTINLKSILIPSTEDNSKNPHFL